MSFSLSQWRTIPVTVAVGILLWLLSWVGFLAIINMLFSDVAKDIRNLAIAVALLIFFLLRASNWARMIAVMANALAIVFLVFLVVALSTVSGSQTAVLVADLVLFAAATYFLFRTATARFFKFHSQSTSESSESKTSPGPKDR
jgi:glucan phosphoethanolaminetransferase (alkaline phosphatase superfamily)